MNPKNDMRAATGVNDPVALRTLAERYGLEFMPAIAPDILDPDLVSRLPVEWARTHTLLPVRVGAGVCVLTTDPTDAGPQEYLALLLGVELRPIVAPRDGILQSIEQCYYRKDDSPTEFLRDMAPSAMTVETVSKTDDLLKTTENAPVTQLVNLILLEAVKRRASDIHFEPFESRLRVRCRIDGVLYDQTAPPKAMEAALISRLKVMAHMDIAERRLPQDGMAKVRVGEREIDIRVSTVPVAEGERMVLRLLDQSSALLPLETLGMAADTQVEFEKLLKLPHGIIIVSGPTGAGKTTTLYAALGKLDAARRNILTIEDPIEYQISNIGQIQVKPKIGLTFAGGLRHILRQDPDVILVGETRDAETAEIAMRAALTGHLVFTTLHTNDAPGAILRLADMNIEPYMLASCLRGILAQRLVRKLCPACAEAAPLTAEQAAVAGPDAKAMIGRKVWHPVGCPACLEGYRGRVGLFELLTVGPEMQEALRGGGLRSEELRTMAASRGMVSLRQDGWRKVLLGLTSLPEIAGTV
jgi:general secretion pathway protein E